MRSLFSTFRAVGLLGAALCVCPAAAYALDATDTATGTGALANENGGVYNTADGYQALNSNTTGNYNTASGGNALLSNTTGYSNTADGALALFANTTGADNTASGVTALQSNTTGNYNTAGGVYALYFNSTGSNNVALGFQALEANTVGSGNVAVGVSALYALKGSHNIALGVNAGKLTTAGDSNIYIGHPGFNGSESKVIRVGQSQTKTFIAGIKGVPLSGATVVVNSAGQLGVVASSARYKKDIKPLADTARKLGELRPVSFRYKSEPEATHYGLIAEEVDKVMPELVVRDDQNRPESVQYQELIPLLLKDRQELRARIDKQKADLAGQRALAKQQQQVLQAELAHQRALIEQEAAALAALRRTLDTRLAALNQAHREAVVTLK